MKLFAHCPYTKIYLWDQKSPKSPHRNPLKSGILDSVLGSNYPMKYPPVTDVIYVTPGCYIQGGFFNCSHPKVSKYKKKPKYRNCSHGNSSEISKYGKSQNIVTVPHCWSGNSLNTLTFFFLCFFSG